MFRSLQPTVPAYTAISSMVGRLHRMSTITPEFSESRREEGTPLPLAGVPHLATKLGDKAPISSLWMQDAANERGALFNERCPARLNPFGRDAHSRALLIVLLVQ